jgi:uncharacterized protein YebE (UPF0316 family)
VRRLGEAAMSVGVFIVLYRGTLKNVLHNREQANRWIRYEVERGIGVVADYTIEIR